MKIQIGEILMGQVGQKVILQNKTFRYLTPCLREYGLEFEKMYKSVFKIALGIGDMIIIDQDKKYEQHLFMLIDTRLYPKNFIIFLDWIRDQMFYEDDYVYGDIKKSPCHMIIIRIPEKYTESLTKFTQGKYSEMFSEADVDTLFYKYPDQVKVLKKDHNYKIRFVHKLNRLYNTSVSAKEYDGELELPPTKQEEFFE
jgi:hypothetical protein